MATKQQLHELVDQLPESELITAARLLEALRDTADPFLRALAMAPLDDETETGEEAAAAVAARDALRRGDVVSDEELVRELGL